MEFNKVILIVLILICAGVFAFFFTAPKFFLYKELKNKIGMKQAEFNAKYDYYAKIAEVYSKLQENRENLAKVDSALPKEISLGTLMYFLQAKALENGLVVRNLVFSKFSPVAGSANPLSNDASNDTSVKEAVFSADLIGSYSALKNFMASVEKSARIFEIPSLSFSSLSPAAKGRQFSQRPYQYMLQIKTRSY